MSNELVLVVEDEAIVARDIGKRLEGLGYRVAGYADNADQAIAIAEKKQPDLVLMDIVLKGKKDGVMAADMIRGALGIPVIYLTAYTDETTLERAKQTEPFGYIVKPFNDREINVAIQMALYRSTMEKKISEREERYRDLFENTSDIIMMLDGEGRFKFVNQRFYNILGYTPEEVNQLKIFDVIDPCCLEQYKNNFQKILFVQQLTVETVFRTKQGQKLNMEGNCSRSMSPGKPDWVRGIFRDLTERKRSDLLRESLYQIANESYLCNNLQELYAKIHAVIRRMININNFYISLYDSETDQLTFPYFIDEYDQTPSPKKLGKGITDYVVKEGKPLLANKETCQKLIAEGQIQIVGQVPLDWLGVPLLVDEKLTGVLAVQSYNKDIRFGQAEKDMLSFVSEQISLAIKRKRDEEQLQKSEELYRSLVSRLPLITYLVSPEGNKPTIFISHQCESILGYSPEEWMSNDGLWLNSLHPEDRDMATRSLENVAVKGLPQDIEYRIFTKDGRMIWGHDYMTLVRAPSGSPLCVQGVMMNVTKRKNMEEALKISEEKYRTLVEHINEVIFLINPEGIIKYISPVVERLLGYRPDSVEGRYFYEFVHPDDLPEIKKSFMLMIDGRNEPPHDFRIINKDHKIIYVHTSSRVLLDKTGQVVGVMGVLTDITQERIMNARLQQAQKMEAIGQLAGGVAHDFNNMLAGIMGQAEMLSNRLADKPELSALAQGIMATGENAAHLTKQLLSFARKGNYRMMPVNIGLLIGNVKSMLDRTIDKRIKIRQELEDGLEAALGDPAMLENAIINLCINARDAMPNGGILVLGAKMAYLDSEYTKNETYKIKEGKYIHIYIRDTGSGMTSEVKEHLFEPFFTTKEPGKGTGLGLASVYGCIKSHNGSIKVYSEPGHGTEFHIYLPAIPNEQVDEHSSTPNRTIKAGTRVLLVDDEEIIRDITSQMLQEKGCQIVTFPDGQKAVEYYREHYREVDVVMLDMIMPKMDGLETYRLMKNINPCIKALLSSGYSMEEQAQELLNDGVNGYLQKPYRLADLIDQIGKALEDKA